MAKFFGSIGYAVTQETAPGVWSDSSIVERPYTGEVIRNRRSWKSTENANPDLAISETISVIADGFTLANMQAMKFVNWRGAKWRIESVEVEYPRVLVTIGGLYSANTTTTPG